MARPVGRHGRDKCACSTWRATEDENCGRERERHTHTYTKKERKEEGERVFDWLSHSIVDRVRRACRSHKGASRQVHI